MSPLKATWPTLSAVAIGIAIGATGTAIAQLGMPMYMKSGSEGGLATLANKKVSMSTRAPSSYASEAPRVIRRLRS